MTGSLSIYHRLRLWWFRGGGRHLAVITSGAALFVALVLTLALWTHDSSVKGPPHSVPLESNLVDLTLVRNATEKGALCLDGSRPGYHLQRGFGSGADNWVLHIEGGGWCNSAESCSFRGGTPLGSSHYMGLQASFAGILSQTTSENPDFYNWNRVKIRYCDGASFAGDREIKGQNGRKLFFRGQWIWEAIMGELLSEGLEKAKQAFLTGCSAGGLATFIHCDSFHALLPKAANVKCLADAGFFLNELKMKMWRSYHPRRRSVGEGIRHDTLTKGCKRPIRCSSCHQEGHNCRTFNAAIHDRDFPLFVVECPLLFMDVYFCCDVSSFGVGCTLLEFFTFDVRYSYFI